MKQIVRRFIGFCFGASESNWVNSISLIVIIALMSYFLYLCGSHVYLIALWPAVGILGMVAAYPRFSNLMDNIMTWYKND